MNKIVLLAVLLLSFSSLAQSPLSNNYVVQRGDSSLIRLISDVDEVVGMIEFIVNDKMSFEIFVDKQADIGRSQLASFLERHAYISEDGDFDTYLNEEKFKQKFIEEFVKVEEIRKSIEGVFNLAQFPDIVAVEAEKQEELRWRMVKTLKQMKVLAENYVILQYRDDDVSEMREMLTKRWNSYIKDSLSFSMMSDALDHINNSHLRELSKLIQEVKTTPLNTKLAEKFNDYVTGYYEQAIADLINESGTYIEGAAERFGISEEDVDRVRDYWGKVYPEVMAETDKIKSFIDTSYALLRTVEEGYLDMCRNFSLLEVDDEGRSLLKEEHVRQLANSIYTGLTNAASVQLANIRYENGFLLAAEYVLTTDYRKFQFYRNFIDELSKKKELLAKEIYDFVGVDTTNLNQDINAFKTKLKEMRNTLHFAQHLVHDPVGALSVPILENIAFATDEVEFRDGRYYLTFTPQYLVSDNAWFSIEDTSAITVDITDPDNWEDGLKECANQLKTKIRSKGITINSKNVVGMIFPAGMPDHLIPNSILYRDGSELTIRFGANAPVSCVSFTNTPVQNCSYQLAYDALESQESFMKSLYEVLKKEVLTTYEERIKSELERIIRESGIEESIQSVQNWLTAHHIQLNDKGATVRIPIAEIVPQWLSGTAVIEIGLDGNFNAKIEGFDVEETVLAILNQNPFIQTEKVGSEYDLYLLDEGSSQRIGRYNPQTGTFKSSETPVRLSLASGYNIHAGSVVYSGNKFLFKPVVIDILGESIELRQAEVLWKDERLSVRIPKDVMDDAQNQILDKIKDKAEGEIVELILSNDGMRSLIAGTDESIVTIQDYIDAVKEKVEMTTEEFLAKVKTMTKNYTGIDNVKLLLDQTPKRAYFDAEQRIAGQTVKIKNIGVVFHNATHAAFDFSKIDITSTLQTSLEKYIKSSLPDNEFISFEKVEIKPTLNELRGEIRLRLNIDEFGVSQSFLTHLIVNENGIRLDLEDQNFWRVAGGQVVAQIDRSLKGETFYNVKITGVSHANKGNADYLKIGADIKVYEDIEVPGNLWVPLDKHGRYKLEADDFMTGIKGKVLELLDDEYTFPTDYFEIRVSDLVPVDRYGSKWAPNTGSFPNGIKGQAEVSVAGVSLPLPAFILDKEGFRFTSYEVISAGWKYPLMFPPYVKITNAGFDLDLTKKTLNLRGDASYIVEGSEYLAKVKGDHILDIDKFEKIEVINKLILLQVLKTGESRQIINTKKWTYQKEFEIKGIADDIIQLQASVKIGLKDLDAGFIGELTLFKEKVADADIDLSFKDMSMDAVTEVRFLGNDWFKASAHADEGLTNVSLKSKVKFGVDKIKVASAGLSVGEYEAYIEFEVLGIDFAIGASNLGNLEDAVEEALKRLLNLKPEDVEEMVKQILKGNFRVNPFSDFGDGKSFGTSSGKGGSKGGSSKSGKGREGKGSRGGKQGGKGKHKGRYTGKGTQTVGAGSPNAKAGKSKWKTEGNNSGFKPESPVIGGGTAGNVDTNGGLIPNENGVQFHVREVSSNCYQVYSKADGVESTFAYLPASYNGVSFINTGTTPTLKPNFINTYGSALVYYEGGKMYCFGDKIPTNCGSIKPIIIPYSLLKFNNDDALRAAARNLQGDNDLRFRLLTSLIYAGYKKDSKVYFFPGIGYAFDINNSEKFMMYAKKFNFSVFEFDVRNLPNSLTEAQKEEFIKDELK